MLLRMPSTAHLFMGLGILFTLSEGASLLAGPALLKLSEAQLRKKQVDEVQYALDIDLPESDEPFQGKVTIDFTLRPQNEPLRVDFDKGVVQSILVNGKAVSYDYDGTAIYLKEQLFKANAANQLNIVYSHAYSKDGNGLYWFRDPIDQQAYTYTHFEPYAANSFMPSFDQPDLKASFKLTVKAPKTWTVVSAVREQSISEAGEKRVWEFPRTLKFSTYLISLHAGPYRVWEDKSFRIPLRIMARQSLASYMPVDQWFQATRHGFDYFDKYLGYSYPFGKYDQVVVPDFNAGAMENVASVTFSERFLVRGKRTQADEQGLAGTILHEMAHMWFGNLVTMQWWNDLWLNESFATYAASLAQAADARFPQTWLGFYRSKTGAYYADQLVTTHPIVTDVADTEEAGSNFDAITYGKGASFLKQLHFLIGEKAFQQGLQMYFQKHAFGNTQLNDFIMAMEKSTGRNLQSFTKEWLQTAGVNSLAADYSCKNDRIESFKLLQGAAPEQPTLREHRTQVALYKLVKDELKLIKEAAVGYQSAVTLWPEAKGLACPDLVFPNHGDYDYAKVKMDAKSFRIASTHLHSIQEPMQRMMVWNTVADMVQDTEISLRDFAKFVIEQLPKEQDYEVLRTIDGKVDRELLGYLAWVSDKSVKNEIMNELITVYGKSLASTKLSSDSKKIQWGTYIDLLTMAARADSLLSILQGKTSWPNVVVDQDQRWTLLLALSELGYADTLKLASAEKLKDPTSKGQRSYLAIEAAFPDYEQKMKLLDPIVKGEKKISGAERWAVMGNLFPRSQRAMKLKYVATYRQEVDQIVKNAEPGVARSYVMSLLPSSCDKSSLPLIEELLAKKFPESIQDGLLVARQSNERCQKVMAKLLTSSQG